MSKKEAAGLTAARQDECHNELYPSVKSLSSLKILIGGLLLFGNRNQKVFWPFFEATLRQYVNLRVASQSGSDKPGATKSGQGSIG